MKNCRITDIMSRQVVFLSPEDDLMTARKRMDGNEIHHLPVMKEGKLVGILSSRDIAQVEYLAQFIGEKLNESAVFKSLTIPELMAKDVYFLSSEAMLSEALTIFSQANFHCLPIIDHGALVGIVSVKDIFRHLQQE